MSVTDRPVVVVVPGDLHLTERGLPNHNAAHWAVGEVNHRVRPDFVQFIGDNVQDASADQFALFRELTDRLRVPWYALIGDHDVKGDPTATRFREHVSDPTGSLSVGAFRFVRLNTQEARPVGLSADQISWFRTEVDAAQKAGERVVVFQHNYPYQVWEDFAGPGIDSWREIVQTHRIHAIITGHTHYWQVANDGRNAVVTTRSIGDPEGGPPGYTVAVFQAEDFAVTYRTVEDHGPLVLITHPREAILATSPAHVVNGVDEVRVRVWSASWVEAAEFRLDRGPWCPLESVSEGLWRGSLPGDQLAKGIHHLTVRVETREGTGEQEIAFAVDPTGRYTAIPCVRPVVNATNFC